MLEDGQLNDRLAFANVLYEVTDPVGTLQLLGSMGLEPSDIATGIGADTETVDSWYEGNTQDVGEHEVAVDGLKL